MWPCHPQQRRNLLQRSFAVSVRSPCPPCLRGAQLILLWFLLLFAAVTPLNAQRQRLSMDPGWRFTLGDPAGAEQPSFDDRTWRSVDLPHDWSIEGTPEQNAPGGGGVGYFPGGTGWYRKTFRLPKGSQGKSAWL